MSNIPTDLVVRIREHEGAYLFPKTADALLKEAANEIERVEREKDGWASVAATRNVNMTLIAEERDHLLNAVVHYVRASKNGEGAKALWWWELQEIEKKYAERVAAPDATADQSTTGEEHGNKG